jgi:kinesin family protein 5
METQYAIKKEAQQKEIEDLKREIDSKNENLKNLTESLSNLKNANDQLQNALSDQPVEAQNGNLSEREKELERTRKSMAKELADFETMKKVLMRDLQTRCEKVVELEMSLDETREQYNNVLRASNNKAQQKKMAFLERNLEQLTNVQKQVCFISCVSFIKRCIDHLFI